MTDQATKDRLEYLRGEIDAERISYSGISELMALAEHIEPGDVQLLQWAGVPEEAEDWPLPALTASTGNIYAAKPEDGDGFPSIGIAWMERESPYTVPVQRDAYLHEMVKRCNAYPSMVDAINKAIEALKDYPQYDNEDEAPSLEAEALEQLRESIG